MKATWKLESYEGEPNRLVVNENGELIADCFPPSHTGHGLPEDYQSNSRLIAAAPNMLAALKSAELFLRGWDDAPMQDSPDCMGHVRGAIRQTEQPGSSCAPAQPDKFNSTLVTIERRIVAVPDAGELLDHVENALQAVHENYPKLKDGITVSGGDIALIIADAKENGDCLSIEDKEAIEFLNEVAKLPADEYLFHV